MARKIKKKKVKEEKIIIDVADKAIALGGYFEEVIAFEMTRDRSDEALKDDMSEEERTEIIDRIKAEVTEQVKSKGFLEAKGEEFIKSVPDVPLYMHWDNAVVTLPAINWQIFLEQIVYFYWLKLEKYRADPTEQATKEVLKLSLVADTIKYRVQMFKHALEKWDATPIDIRKFVLLLIKIKNAIRRSKEFWKRETEIEVTVGKGKKKKTKKIIDKNYLCPKYMTRLTKAENLIREAMGRIPLCSLTDELLDELDFEVHRYLGNESNKEVRKMEKRGESLDDTNKIYEFLELPFLNDCVSIYALPGYIEKKFSTEIKRCEFKKFGTLKKHLAAYSEMITKEVMIVTDEEIRILNERNKTKPI